MIIICSSDDSGERGLTKLSAQRAQLIYLREFVTSYNILEFITEKRHTKNTMKFKKIYQLCFLLYLSLLKRVSCRNQGCGLLILLDEPVSALFQNNETIIRNRVGKYIEKLNQIYKTTILKDPPNNNIYFFIEHLTVLRSYLPDCLNKGVNQTD